MPTTSQMLANYPDILLTVLAELRGAFLEAADNRQQAVDLLSAQITDPTSVQFAFQEVSDMSEEATAAVELLLKEGGEIAEAQFSRQFGSIRQMGPAKLEREAPWFNPESIAELLFYYGLLGRGFKGAGQQAHTIVYIPSDVIPWLPRPQGASEEDGLAVIPVPPPPAARIMGAEDSFLLDVGTLLGFVHVEGLRLTEHGPQPDDIDGLVQRFLLPFDHDDPMLNRRLALMLHLANRMRWFRRDEAGVVRLAGNRVYAFLEAPRTEQRTLLWQSWVESPDWNDLCRTPGLECTDTGNWQNDPLQTRQAVLRLLAGLQPGVWYSQADVIQAIRQVEPDFQRPTGNYDTWYIRNIDTQEFLKGFEQWEAVEGEMLRFLCHGPLHWLGALDLAEPSAGDDYLLSLSNAGARWLGHENVAGPDEPQRRPFTVGDDFTVALAHSASLAERFRVERFAQWQSSYPRFLYQINQRSLRRAAEEGITPQRVLDFLKKRTRNIPPKVGSAMEKVAGKQTA